jgi:hypothetical protein
MTSQHTDTSDLSLVADPAPQVWSPGTPDDGLDARLEIARLDAEARIVIRDSRYPTGPALVFSRATWNALIGGKPELVDLR